MNEFAVELTELEKIATQNLPSVANALRGPATVLLTHEGLGGPGHYSAVDVVQNAYAHFTDTLGNRQRVGCDRVDATATALRAIVAAYWHADGQA
ncbi:hypothetical protein [Actinocrispum sp. NPDC049592]|uniref:hypothetical protein n=1 Tax=Actinocrispum sp. NPDC049592 TaxID=3154835 RepID=UPI003421A23E